MNPSFNIPLPADNEAPGHLFAEIGVHGVTFTVLTEGNAFSALTAYNFDAQQSIPGQLSEILNNTPLLDREFKKKDIIWAFPEAVLVPYDYFNAAATRETIELVYGDKSVSEIKTDLVYRHNFHTVYSMPANVLNLVNNKIGFANHSHLYSLLPDIVEKEAAQLLAVFYRQQLTVLLVNNGQLQMIQTFAYKTGQDAAYHLLNSCARFDVSPLTVQLQLSGLVDEQSNLYSELYKYFQHLAFKPLPADFAYAEGLKAYPSHFFSYLFATASCV